MEEQAAHHPLTPLFVSSFLDHQPDASIGPQPNLVDLGFGDLSLRLEVSEVLTFGQRFSASLFFEIWGGSLGETRTFMSTSGYGETQETAVVEGTCLWCQCFIPLFKTAFGNADPPASAEVFEHVIHGHRYFVAIDGLDRAITFDAAAALPSYQAVRAKLGGSPFLLPAVLRGRQTPILPIDRPAILSLFVFEQSEQRIVELKLFGEDWHVPMGIEAAPMHPPGSAVLLRELAVLVPVEGLKATPLARSGLRSTFEGLSTSDRERSRRALRWRGWTRHRGVLEATATTKQLAQVERIVGPLPDDYRSFLSNVAGPGAGPGYGLIAPWHPGQKTLARGAFRWRDGGEVGDVGGVLALAHAGCNIMWVLVLDGPHRGEVWVDGRGSDEIASRVAGSFDEWYRAWLDSTLRNQRSFIQWDSMACASANIWSQVVESLEREGYSRSESLQRLPETVQGKLALKAGQGPYFREGSNLDPCQGCVELTERLGFSRDMFEDGTEPLAHLASRGIFGRWLA